MKQIIVFPRGQLSEKDKERMAKAGIVAVEADDPSKVVSLLPEMPMLRADDFLMSLFKGVEAGKGWSDHRCTVAFFNELHDRTKKNEAAARGDKPPAGRE